MLTRVILSFVEMRTLILRPLAMFSTTTNKPKPGDILMPTFQVFKFQDSIAQYLKRKQFHTPSSIQEKVFASMTAEKHNFYMVAPTGSGKTLAYLLPIFSKLKQEETLAESILTRPNRPRALIIVSSKELVMQVGEVCKDISHNCKTKVGMIGVGATFRRQKQLLDSGIDILVTTLDRLDSLREHVFFSLLSFVVVDEADTLVDSGQGDKIVDLVETMKKRQLKAKETGHQVPTLMFVSATFTPALEKFFNDNFRKYERDQRFYTKQQLQKIKTKEQSSNLSSNKMATEQAQSLTLYKVIDKNSHLNLQNIKHQFIHCASLDKHEPLLTLLKQLKSTITTMKSSIIVFCNSVKSLHQLEYFLNSQKIEVATLHAELPKRARVDNFSRFKSRESGGNILLTTDLGSRGLDFDSVHHVINYDFPRTVSDYLHRAGRTGRAGRKGTVYTLYHNKNLDTINELRAAHADNKPLDVRSSAYSLANKEALQAKYHRSKGIRTKNVGSYTSRSR